MILAPLESWESNGINFISQRQVIIQEDTTKLNHKLSTFVVPCILKYSLMYDFFVHNYDVYMLSGVSVTLFTDTYYPSFIHCYVWFNSCTAFQCSTITRIRDFIQNNLVFWGQKLGEWVEISEGAKTLLPISEEICSAYFAKLGAGVEIAHRWNGTIFT